MRVVVLVPRRAGVADRDRLWDFAQEWWRNDHPDWPIVEGHHDHGPFNRSAALNDAAAKAGDWDVAVLIDADVLADPAIVRTAVDVAQSTGRMVIGFNERIHLSQKGTEKILRGFTGDWKSAGMVEHRYFDSCSSLVVVTRGLWDDVGGFDEMFEGWGWEDVAFRVACETISAQPAVVLASTLWHLWHRTSHENNRREPTFVANEARGKRYRAAHWDVDAVRALLDEQPEEQTVVPLAETTRIPRILHRCVPAETSDEVEGWWTHFQQLHPHWEFRTWRDPLDPADWPETGDLFDRCTSGAQLAGLVRLEALYKHGGVYVDSDVEPYRSLEPLLQLPAFAAWEDKGCVPDAVLGAEPGHPAFAEMIQRARTAVETEAGAWLSGPGVTTKVLVDRPDVLCLPPGSFYPYHYSDKVKGRRRDHRSEQPWCFGAHHWAASWVDK